MNEKLKTLLKIGVSVSLFSFVIYSAGPSKIWGVLKEANLIYLLSAILLTVIIGVGLSAKKLQILLRAKGEDIGFFSVLRYYYIGTFFNLFLPTTIGGDIIKAHKISGETKASEEAYSSVFMERFTGLIAVVTLAIISSLLYFGKIPTNALLIIYLVFLPGIFLFLLFMTKKSAVRKLKSIYNPLFSLLEFVDFKRKMRRFYNSVNRFKKQRRWVLFAVGISFLFHIILISSNFLLSKSVGMGVSFYYFLVFIPVCVVLLLLPISIRGFGVREVLYVYFFTQVGATPAQAFSMAFLFQIVGILRSGLGGVIYLTSEISY